MCLFGGHNMYSIYYPTLSRHWHWIGASYSNIFIDHVDHVVFEYDVVKYEVSVRNHIRPCWIEHATCAHTTCAHTTCAHGGGGSIPGGPRHPLFPIFSLCSNKKLESPVRKVEKLISFSPFSAPVPSFLPLSAIIRNGSPQDEER